MRDSLNLGGPAGLAQIANRGGISQTLPGRTGTTCAGQATQRTFVHQDEIFEGLRLRAAARPNIRLRASQVFGADI